MTSDAPYFDLLKNRITLDPVPFTDRDSRLLLFRSGNDTLWVGLAEYEKDPRQDPPIAAWHFTNKEGDPLACESTTYPHQIICQTSEAGFWITFVDQETLLVALPIGHCGMRFCTHMEEAMTDQQGGILRRSSDATSSLPCSLVYTTNAALTHNEIVALPTGQQELRLEFDAAEGDALLLNITRLLRFNRTVPATDRALADSAARWHQWFAAAPQVEERYRAHYYYCWWVMGMNLIQLLQYPQTGPGESGSGERSSPPLSWDGVYIRKPNMSTDFASGVPADEDVLASSTWLNPPLRKYPYVQAKREGMVPSKLGYVGIWHWDSYFHALALRHSDMQLAQDQLRIMLDFQLANGLIPDIVHDEGILAHTSEIVEADITKPPLTAWAAWKLYELAQDRAFLNEVYDSIVRFQNWWFRESDPDSNGLCEYLHPWSSGLDNSPLFDQGLPVETPDLNAYLCMQYDYLSKIARVLGRNAESEAWDEQAGQIAQRMIDLRWDEQAGLFWATRHGERLPVRTPFNLFPLITGRMPEHIADRLVATLTDERQFWGHHPVPTVAFDDRAHNPVSMWRGPVWLNVNYLLIDGLVRAGYAEQADKLRQRTLEMAMAVDDCYEYYHPVTGQKPPRATNAFGWSAALFIDLAIAASR